MPLIVQPVIRQLQRAMEDNGLILARNSVGRNQLAAKEAAGQIPLVAPIQSWILRGGTYTSPISGA